MADGFDSISYLFHLACKNRKFQIQKINIDSDGFIFQYRIAYPTKLVDEQIERLVLKINRLAKTSRPVHTIHFNAYRFWRTIVWIDVGSALI